MPPEKKALKVNAIQVNVTENPGKPLIILTRMISQKMGIWDRIWDDLARHFTVANFNHLETSAAKRMDTPKEAFRDFARICVDVASGLGFGEFHILGWVGGTHVALRCAVDHPAQVKSLILLDPHYELPDMRHIRKGNEFKQALLEYKDRELYAYYWVMAGFSIDFIENHFDEVEKLVAARMAGDKFVRVDVERFMKWANALRRNWVNDEEMERITAPTLVVATELERWNAGPSVSMAREVQKRIPKSKMAVLQNVGELVLIEAPEKFLAVLEPFVRSVT
jgi:pimeloyl-ACP methyl ester carboxylesterase